MNNQDNLTISESSSTLGLGWTPSSDSLHFPTNLSSKSDEITKRTIMSNSFKIFDPLGLLSPYIIQAKMIMQNQEPLSEFASQQGIKFRFIPAYAPHFGGLWEAGVKSAKHHLKRVIGDSRLTFEEISTLFAQVEAILNSRPLCPLSCSPNDLLSLTPGHFIIGRPLTSLPSPAAGICNDNQRKRYERLESMRNHFWQRWQKEYLSELQQRTKWRTNTTSLSVGDMVLIAEDGAPPLCWRLGRVVQLFPGPDGVSRVADVHTTKGRVRRSFTRLCPLPTADELKS